MRHDILHAWRLMRRQPASTAATILTLAVGIGSGAAIFTAVDRLLLRPLPFPDSGRLVFVEHAPLVFSQTVRGGLAPSFLRLPAIAAAGTWATGGMNLDGRESARLAAAVVDDGFFATLGVSPLIGQTLPRPDGASRFVVVSYELWRTRLGAERAAIGRPLTLNNRPYTVTGVMPPGFAFPGRTDIWLPPMVDLQATGGAYAPEVIARISSDLTFDQARAAIAGYDRAQRPASADPDPSRDAMSIRPLGAELTRQARPTLLLLAGSVTLLLLVISASVANLLLARVAARDVELTIRRALGATRWRLARQLMIESLMLSLAGGALATLGADWALRSLRVLAPASIDAVGFAVDRTFLVLAIGVSIVTAVVFAIAPGLAAATRHATHAARFNRDDRRAPGWHRFRGGLIVAQMAIALTLLAASTATVGALIEATHIDPGFGSRRALAFTVTLPSARFESAAAISTFFEQAHDRLQAVPGVRRIGATGFLPGSQETGVGIAIKVREKPAPLPDERVFASYLSASPDYFAVAGIRVVAGRPFGVADRAGAPRVVVLSESAVKRLFPDGESAIGRTVETAWNPKSPTAHEVVGVVADVRLRSLTATAGSLQQVYVPLLQSPPFGNLSFVADVEGAPTDAVASIRAAVSELDRSVPAYDFRPLDDAIDRYLASYRLSNTLVSGFAIVTLLVSAIGLYGLMSQRVIERTREIGIRLALGADRKTVRWRIVGQGTALALTGAAVGAAGAASALGLFHAVVPTLTSTGPWTVAASAAVLVSVGVLATWLPATRVMKIDPMRALRR